MAKKGRSVSRKPSTRASATPSTKAAVESFLKSPAGKALLAEALIAVAGALVARYRKEGARAVGETASRVSAAVGEAAQAFIATVRSPRARKSRAKEIASEE